MSSAPEPVIEPAIVLAAYAEPIATGRRVLFVGPATSALPARLLERGARVVLACDPDPVRVAEATATNRLGGLSFSALSEGNLALRDGAFDVCIVEDAGIADPVSLVKKLRRALTPRGVAILASLNPEARVPLMPHRPSGVVSLDYYALYDAVKAEFEHVRMLGQAPFVGYVVADFAPEGTPEPSLDTAFLPSGAEEPELFIAVASQQPVALDAFAVVQLPYRSVLTGPSTDSDALRRERGAEADVRGKLSELEAELVKERQAAAAKHAELTQARKLAASKDAELGQERATAAARAAELVSERQASAARDAKLREAETGVFARDAELTALRRELEQKNRQLAAQEGKLNELQQKVAQGPSPEELSAAAADLSALEQALTERGEHVRKLERELREAERIGKELLRQLPAAGDTAPPAQRQANEAELAQKLAKTQADLVATRWALEAAVKRGPSSDTGEA
jgi:SAM-dependent methyltransferase